VTDLAIQADFAFRLLIAAALGAAVGVEREIHGHPAGMRTHLLVSVGAAAFTVLSIHGFSAFATPDKLDPSRVAAQIVSGIGFLGAGAILKDGPSIRGLTTAASLWATAAIGMAAGTGQYLIAAVGTAIVVFSLWPLNRIAERLQHADKAIATVRVTMERLEALAEITRLLSARRLEILGVRTERLGKGRYDAEFEIRARPGANTLTVIEEIGRIDGVEIASSDSPD